MTIFNGDHKQIGKNQHCQSNDRRSSIPCAGYLWRQGKDIWSVFSMVYLEPKRAFAGYWHENLFKWKGIHYSDGWKFSWKVLKCSLSLSSNKGFNLMHFQIIWYHWFWLIKAFFMWFDLFRHRGIGHCDKYFVMVTKNWSHRRILCHHVEKFVITMKTLSSCLKFRHCDIIAMKICHDEKKFVITTKILSLQQKFHHANIYFAIKTKKIGHYDENPVWHPNQRW